MNDAKADKWHPYEKVPVQTEATRTEIRHAMSVIAMASISSLPVPRRDRRSVARKMAKQKFRQVRGISKYVDWKKPA